MVAFVVSPEIHYRKCVMNNESWTHVLLTGDDIINALPVQYIQLLESSVALLQISF